MSSLITHNLSSSICLLGDAFYLGWSSMSVNIFLKRILLIVCLDWALWRHCLCGELQSACFTVCCQVSPNVFLQICLRSYFDIFLDHPQSFFQYLSAGWCVLSELVLNCVCQYLPEEDPADCLSGLSSVASPSLWWAQSACFTVCCWSACLLAFVDVSQNSIDVCWGSSDVFLFCLSAPLSGSFKEGLAGVCLDWVRVSSISFWWTHQVLLEVSPTACLSVSPSGTLGFLLGGLAGAFDVCCSVFLDSPIHRDWGLSVTLYHFFVWVFSLFLMELAFTLLLSL